MLSIEPKELEVRQRHKYLLGGVAPRPIAFVSTVSEDGVNNLSPFSFFNAFGANPPTVAFSPARRGRDNTTKDTYENIIKTKECVIHAVTYEIVQQMNLASAEYDTNIDEFVKAGFTALESDLVKPKRVKESPFQLECKLVEMVELGGKAGSGNLAICEVVKYHISDDILTDGEIDPYKIDLVGRNGGIYYTRANGKALFEVEKPGAKKGIGFDGLPKYMLNSDIYSGNDLGKFATEEIIPNIEDVNKEFSSLDITDSEPETFERAARLRDYKSMLKSALALEKKDLLKVSYFERTAKTALEKNDIDTAWKIAVYSGKYFK